MTMTLPLFASFEDITMSYDTLHDLLIAELQDIHSAETQLLAALPLMVKHATTTELSEAFTTHLADTRQQVDRLVKIFTTLGVTPKGDTCKGMQGVLAEAAETLKKKGDPLVIDAAIIGAAQRVEHYEIAAYTSAIALAKSMKHTDVVKHLEASLAEEQSASELLTSIGDSKVLAKAPGMPTAGSKSR